jgi:mRNA-degrading endonuclease RelE of RelBE toxin-antitoxin system
MDRLEKTILKFSQNERDQAIFIMEMIKINKLDNLDIKKLSGTSDLFRVRKGKIRIVFQKTFNENKIIYVGHRSEKTYKKF